MNDDPYTYPGTTVLRNKLGIADTEELDRFERAFVVQRAREGIPTGAFDLTHLCAIHRHLFQDVYDWAGELRTVEISKGGHQFQFRQFIETGMGDVHRRLRQSDFLRDLSACEFAEEAAKIIGDINYVHPFREGNGRAQLFYLEQLAKSAGHPIALGQLDRDRWIEASRAAHNADYGPMAEEIGRAIQGRI